MPVDPMTGAPLPYPDEMGGGQTTPPPDLLAMLGGGMAPPMGDPMAGGPAGPTPPQGGEDPVEFIRQIMRDVLSPVDANEEAAIANIAAKFQQLIAAQAKEADAALGVSPAQKFMRRQAASGGQG